MGKGDKRTRRGKISAGSFGKTRKKYKKPALTASTETKAAAAPKEPKKRTAKRVPAAETPAGEAPAAETVEAPVAETPAEQPTAETPEAEAKAAE